MSKIQVSLIFAFIIGVVFVCIGLLFKYLHWSYGNAILNIGMMMQAISFIAFVFLVFREKKNK